VTNVWQRLATFGNVWQLVYITLASISAVCRY